MLRPRRISRAADRRRTLVSFNWTLQHYSNVSPRPVKLSFSASVGGPPLLYSWDPVLRLTPPPLGDHCYPARRTFPRAGCFRGGRTRTKTRGCLPRSSRAPSSAASQWAASSPKASSVEAKCNCDCRRRLRFEPNSADPSHSFPAPRILLVVLGRRSAPASASPSRGPGNGIPAPFRAPRILLVVIGRRSASAPASPSRGPGNGILRAETGGRIQARTAGERSEFGSQTATRLANRPKLRGLLPTWKPRRFADRTCDPSASAWVSGWLHPHDPKLSAACTGRRGRARDGRGDGGSGGRRGRPT